MSGGQISGRHCIFCVKDGKGSGVLKIHRNVTGIRICPGAVSKSQELQSFFDKR